jgi:hypothetical protein
MLRWGLLDGRGRRGSQGPVSDVRHAHLHVDRLYRTAKWKRLAADVLIQPIAERSGTRGVLGPPPLRKRGRCLCWRCVVASQSHNAGTLRGS